MYPDLFEFFCRSQSTCHCLLYCLKKINMDALLLGMYYFMCRCAFYQLRLVRVYVNRAFGQKRNSLLLLRFLGNLRPSRGPSWPVFFSKSRILLNLSFLLFFEVLVTRCFEVARKILVTFAPLILGDFRGHFWPFFFLGLELFKIVYSCNSCDICK